MNTVTSADGTTIAYDRTGDGPAVILVDGAFCSRAFGPMPGLAPLLAKRFTVYTYDRRGRNDSGDTEPLVADGGMSPAWIHNGVQAVADAAPDTQRRTLPGQTHQVKAAALAPVLVEFLTGKAA